MLSHPPISGIRPFAVRMKKNGSEERTRQKERKKEKRKEKKNQKSPAVTTSLHPRQHRPAAAPSNGPKYLDFLFF
jgi:hypothetical protein